MENSYTKPATSKSIEEIPVFPKKPERKPKAEPAANAEGAAPAAAKAAGAPEAQAVPKKAAMSIEEQRAAMEAKLANMDPEKAAKVRANFEAKVAKQAQQEG